MKARVIIRNKTGVFDPQGKVVEGGLRRLGFDDVAKVRVGKVIDLELETTDAEAARRQIDAMCAEFLVNPVIEDFTVELASE